MGIDGDGMRCDATLFDLGWKQPHHLNSQPAYVAAAPDGRWAQRSERSEVKLAKWIAHHRDSLEGGDATTS
jgi:hypothetical protein